MPDNQNRIFIDVDDETFWGLNDLARYLEIERSWVVERLVKAQIKLLGNAVLGISPSISPSPDPTADPEWAEQHPSVGPEPHISVGPGSHVNIWPYGQPQEYLVSASETASCSAPPLPWYEEIWDLLTSKTGIHTKHKWYMIKRQLEIGWIDWTDDLKRKWHNFWG